MGAQAYSDDDSIAILTTDASWLAYRLCSAVMTDAERDEIDPEFSPGMRDGNAGALAATVQRAHARWPIKFSTWRTLPEASGWKGRRGPFDRCDWILARRFLMQCARARSGFRVSY